jgi:hypothetical protein
MTIHRLDVDDLCRLLDLVLDYSTITFGGHTVRQKLGIPIGISPGGDIANFFLACHEFLFMSQDTGAAPFMWFAEERTQWIRLVTAVFRTASYSQNHVGGWRVGCSPLPFPPPALAAPPRRPLPFTALLTLNLQSLSTHLQANDPHLCEDLRLNQHGQSKRFALKGRLHTLLLSSLKGVPAHLPRHHFLSAQFTQAVSAVHAVFDALLTPPVLAALRKEEILSSFRHVQRYIDDLAAINNPYIDQLLYSSQNLDGVFFF